MGASKNTLKKKASTLRKKGLSYNEIRTKVPVSKGTLSMWLKDIPLSPKNRERLYTKRIEYLALGSQSQRERRKREVDEIIEKAEMEVSSFQTLAAYKLFGAALYWAEGNKSNGCGIANSDPHLILFMTQWFRRIFGVSSAQMTAHLNIYPQQNEKELKYFWSNLTGIPLENFGKSFIKPLNKGYKKNTLYYGTCKVRIQKGTDLRIRIFGWVKGMLRELDPQVELAQRKWEKLREVPRPINLIAK